MPAQTQRTSSQHPKTAPRLSPPSQQARSSSSRKPSPTPSALAKSSSSRGVPREFEWTHSGPGNGMVLSYNDRHSFIIKPDSWETAVDLVIREFPELKQIERSRITLEKRCAVGEDKVLVRITPEVWTSVVAPLVQWEVIEVHITEEEEEEEEVVDTPAAVTKKRSSSVLGRLFNRSSSLNRSPSPNRGQSSNHSQSSSRSASPSGSCSSSRNHYPNRSSSPKHDLPPKYERPPKYEESVAMKSHVQEPKDRDLLSPDWVPPPRPSSRRSKTP